MSTVKGQMLATEIVRVGRNSTVQKFPFDQTLVFLLKICINQFEITDKISDNF